MKTCLVCQTENNDLVKFCKTCRHELPDNPAADDTLRVRCPHCNAPNPAAANPAGFCNTCGKRMSGGHAIDNVAAGGPIGRPQGVPVGIPLGVVVGTLAVDAVNTYDPVVPDNQPLPATTLTPATTSDLIAGNTQIAPDQPPTSAPEETRHTLRAVPSRPQSHAQLQMQPSPTRPKSTTPLRAVPPVDEKPGESDKSDWIVEHFPKQTPDDAQPVVPPIATTQPPNASTPPSPVAPTPAAETPPLTTQPSMSAGLQTPNHTTRAEFTGDLPNQTLISNHGPTEQTTPPHSGHPGKISPYLILLCGLIFGAILGVVGALRFGDKFTLPRTTPAVALPEEPSADNKAAATPDTAEKPKVANTPKAAAAAKTTHPTAKAKAPDNREEIYRQKLLELRQQVGQ